MKHYLEPINKYLLQLALALLIFRNGSFGASGIPKLFECVMVVVAVLAVADIVLNKRFKTFFYSIPRNIRIALAVFYTATFLGWLLAVVLRHIPSTLNMVYEIGMFSVAIITFLLILYYSREDKDFATRCFYMLLMPALFAICIMIPSFAFALGVAQGGIFKGFTDNVEIISKILLVPGVALTTYTLFKQNVWWHRAGYVVLAVTMGALVWWTTERAAMLGFVIGVGTVWLTLALLQKNTKQAARNALLLILIAVGGFLAVPHQGKKASIDRVLNTDANQSGYDSIKHQSVSQIFQDSITTPDNGRSVTDTEPRFRIWKYYLDQVIHNPFGLGPNTHMEARIEHPRRVFVNPGPHNAYLQAWLWGGVIGLISFLYILIYVFGQLRVRLRTVDTPLVLSILGSLVALCAAIFFNDNLSSYWLWALLAIALRI